MEWTLDPILEKVEYVFSFFMVPGVQQRKHRTEFVSVQIVFFMTFFTFLNKSRNFPCALNQSFLSHMHVQNIVLIHLF